MIFHIFIYNIIIVVIMVGGQNETSVCFCHASHKDVISYVFFRCIITTENEREKGGGGREKGGGREREDAPIGLKK